MSPGDSLRASKERRIRFGGWLAMPEPLVVEAAARAKPFLVRLPDEQLSLIPRVLDHGASGIVLAMASEPTVVAAAIARARYQPEGLRSYGGQRYGMRPEPDDPAEVRPAIYAMLET